MTKELTLVQEIGNARKKLKAEDRKLIKPDLAQRAFHMVLDKKKRNGSGESIRFTLHELYIGRAGRNRQKIFGAYWRLLRKMLDERERNTRLDKTKKEAA